MTSPKLTIIASAALVLTFSTSLLIACGDVEREPIPKREDVILEKPEFTGTGLGFVTVDQLNFPNVAAAANRSVVKVVVPTGESIPVEDISDTQPVDLKMLHQKILQEPASVLRDVKALEVSRCLKNPADLCLIRTNFIRASGFFIRDGSQLATSLPIAQTALNLASKSQRAIGEFTAEELKKMPLAILIYGNRGEKVADESVTVYVKEKISYETDESRFSFAVLQLPIQMGNPLEKATKFEIGERAFIAGYPVRTHTRQALQAQDSDGSQLHFSQGVSVLQTSDQKTIVVKADNEDGMIGAPIMNELGQYIGILTQGNTDITNKRSYGISAHGF